jgi:putative membrane protein
LIGRKSLAEPVDFLRYFYEKALAAGCVCGIVANCFGRNEEVQMRWLLMWIFNAAALIAVAYFLKGIHVDNFTSALVAALILGLVNTLIRPVLVLLTLPITVITLGLFILVINGFLFWFVGSVLRGFTVADFWWGVGGALLYSVFSWALSSLLPKKE